MYEVFVVGALVVSYPSSNLLRSVAWAQDSSMNAAK
jgi:hypothetical protein